MAATFTQPSVPISGYMPYELPITSCFAPLLRDRDAPSLPELYGICRRALHGILRSKRWENLRSQLQLISRHKIQEQDTNFAQAVKDIVLDLRPWRTGPITLPNLVIDSEWISTIKWNRLAPLLPNLEGVKIADVGCSNGYFMYQLSEHYPSLVVGFDPVDRCFLQFVLTQIFYKKKNLAFIPAGLESLQLIPRYFDVIFCMGVLYHQRDPITAMKNLYNALRPGGTIFLESLSIPNKDEVLLIPRERYAKMRNAWSIPSPTAMESLLHRAGFKNLARHEFGPVTTDEQRRTEFAHFESLADFLDPSDSSKTIEGYPAPHSTLVIGQKPST